MIVVSQGRYPVLQVFSFDFAMFVSIFQGLKGTPPMSPFVFSRGTGSSPDSSRVSSAFVRFTAGFALYFYSPPFLTSISRPTPFLTLDDKSSRPAHCFSFVWLFPWSTPFWRGQLLETL